MRLRSISNNSVVTSMSGKLKCCKFSQDRAPVAIQRPAFAGYRRRADGPIFIWSSPCGAARHQRCDISRLHITWHTKTVSTCSMPSESVDAYKYLITGAYGFPVLAGEVPTIQLFTSHTITKRSGSTALAKAIIEKPLQGTKPTSTGRSFAAEPNIGAPTRQNSLTSFCMTWCRTL